MGLYNGSLGNYYHNPSLETLGGYQFVKLKDIINNFRVAYVGEDKIISKISRADIKFHAMRGIQELSYDTFRSCKTLELEVPPSLMLPLPHDYVEYVKITWTDDSGHCHTILNCKSCPKDPLSYEQYDADGYNGKTPYYEGDIVVGEGERREVVLTEGYFRDVEKDVHNVLVETRPLIEGCKPYGDDPNSWNNCCPDGFGYNFASRTCEKYGTGTETIQVWVPPVYGYSYDYTDPREEDSTTWASQNGGVNEIGNARYGLDPQHMNTNGCFWINCRTGKIHFGSKLAGKTVIIQYISDGLATDDEMIVHKFAEEAMYKHIAHAILNTRANTDRNIVATFKKERFAAVRNAKIRLSSIKLEELTQIMRGKSKWIKH